MLDRQPDPSQKDTRPGIFPVTCFEAVSKLPGVRLISLQKGDGEGDLKSLPQGMAIESFDDLDAGPDAFVDTAAVMTCVDLVITNDTSISHLAGALGVPTFVALQYVPDWRWMFDRADSPWLSDHAIIPSKIGWGLEQCLPRNRIGSR